MISFLFLLINTFVHGETVVQTNSGPVTGITLETKNVEAFLGIPFAEPPVGKLRFAKPVPKSPWTETFEAKQLPPSCIQNKGIMSTLSNESIEMDEDCLYLNLWVPKSESTLKTIMVWIHGGAFKAGSSSMKLYDGANLSEHGDVIVASMNYRVASLGFFSAFIDEAAGSMGMYDQVLALQWIKDNAKHFGGDPDNIVIFGESAGASSVSLHMVSPLSQNLFNRAILQSSAAVHPVYSNKNFLLRKTSQMISKFTGCATDDEDVTKNPKAVVECMKNLSPEKFSEADKVLLKNSMLMPRVGDEFLPENPTDLLRKGQFKDTEVLIGVNKDESAIFVALQLGAKTGDIFGKRINVNTFNETEAKRMVQSLAKNEQYDKIIQNYFKRVKEQYRYTYLHAVVDIMGDAQFTCPTMYFADFQSLKCHSVYFYLFDYRSPSSKFSKWVGVPHMDEIQYIFGNPFWKAFSEDEEHLSKDMMDMWVAFSKTGNPNVPGGPRWPKYNFEDPKYLLINMKDRVGVKPDNFRCEQWRHLYHTTIDEEVIQNLKNCTS